MLISCLSRVCCLVWSFFFFFYKHLFASLLFKEEKSSINLYSSRFSEVRAGLHHWPSRDESAPHCRGCGWSQNETRLLRDPHHGNGQNGQQTGGHRHLQRHRLPVRERPRQTSRGGAHVKSFFTVWLFCHLNMFSRLLGDDKKGRPGSGSCWCYTERSQWYSAAQ